MNMSLWEKWATPDPKYISKVELGRRKFDSIAPHYRVRLMTEEFGPMGGRWYAKEVENQTITVATQKGPKVYWFSKVEVGYVYGEKGNLHTVEQWGGTELNSDEAPKMAFTDALGKCLSYLGIAADIYMNERNDDKYYRMEQERNGLQHDGVPRNGPSTINNHHAGGDSPHYAAFKANLEPLLGAEWDGEPGSTRLTNALRWACNTKSISPQELKGYQEEDLGRVRSAVMAEGARRKEVGEVSL